MLPFDTLDPELAACESRAVHVLDRPDLPAGTYVFREFYCNEPRCDCRRVLLQITSLERRRVVATINYGFEPPAPPFEDEGQVFLDPINPQSELSGPLLGLFEHMMATDDAYRARLVQHYALWKQAVDDPSHPAHTRMRSAAHDDSGFRPAFAPREPVRRDGPKVGPNAPCPCGSGKKYKRCCGQ